MGAFDRWRRGPIRRVGEDRYVVELDEHLRALIGGLVEDLRALIETDDPRLFRLFPPPYGDDEERNQGYAVLAGAELRERRIESLEVVSAHLDATELDGEQLSAWMRSINDVRLVLGTSLGITDDGQEPPSDPSDVATYTVYELLGVLLESIVQALDE